MVQSDLDLELNKAVKIPPKDKVEFSEMWNFKILRLTNFVNTGGKCMYLHANLTSVD
jgi:hypothetical protein